MRFITRWLALFVLIATCFGSGSESLGMDAKEIRELAKKPHSRENLVPELKIYPNARKYKTTFRVGPSAEKLETKPEAIVTEKTVDGKYIVTSRRYKPDSKPVTLVVQYDQKEKVFRKWEMDPDDSVEASMGTPDFKNRVISWVTLVPEGKGYQMFGIESHSDTTTTFRELFITDGKIAIIAEGAAQKIE